MYRQAIRNMCVAGAASLALMGSALVSHAAVSGARIAVVAPNASTITSTSVASMAIVTKSIVSVRKSYIECYFQTANGQVGLHLESRDQRRIEAFYQQLVTAAASGQSFQITAYASGTYQQDGYVASLDSDLVYLILG